MQTVPRATFQRLRYSADCEHGARALNAISMLRRLRARAPQSAPATPDLSDLSELSGHCDLGKCAIFRGGRVVLASTLALAGLLAACGDPGLEPRRAASRDSLGEIVYGTFQADLRREDKARAEGLALEHDDLVSAIDHLFPEAERHDVQAFLVRLLPLYDDGTIPATTDHLAQFLNDLAGSPDALAAAAVMAHRVGYVDATHEDGMLRRIARRPDFNALAKSLIRLDLEHDGLDAAGAPAPGESDAMRRLLAGLSKRIQDVSPSIDDQRDVVLLTDLMLREDPGFAATDTSGGSRPQIVAPAAGPALASSVRRDVRGMAQVRAEAGQIPAPFVDRDGDGLADVDALGRFVAADGTPLDLPPFSTDSAAGSMATPAFAAGFVRDPAGRLLGGAGQPLFDYAALDRTMLAGTLRDARALVAKGVPMKAVRSLERALGGRTGAGTYGPDDGLVDLAHAAGAAARGPDLLETLELVQALLEQHTSALAWTELEMERLLDSSDKYDARLRPGNTFFVDMMRVIRKILAVPGLAEDLLQAFRDPAVADFAVTQVQLLSHRKNPITVADFDAGTIFDTPMDWSRPDTPDNRSLLERALHLIHATNGVTYAPANGAIFTIEDIAEYYMQAILGVSHITKPVTIVTQLPLFPGPDDLARFLNRDFTILGIDVNARDSEGQQIRFNDGDTLFAASASGLTRVLRPVVFAFFCHGDRTPTMDPLGVTVTCPNGERIDLRTTKVKTPLLFELFEVLYQHWATDQSGDYTELDPPPPGKHHALLSGLRNYEPMLTDQFQNTMLVDAARQLLIECGSLKTASGRSADDLLLTFVRRLFGQDPNLRTRTGAAVVTLDGVPTTPLSPFDLMRDARDRLRTAVRYDARGAGDWDDLVSAVHDTLLAAERDAPGTRSAHFKNPRALPFAVQAVRFLRSRAERHVASGDLDTWIAQDLEKNVEDLVTAPELPAALDLIDAADADPDLSDALTGLRDELLAEDQGLQDLIAVAANALGGAKDARMSLDALKFFAHEIAPDTKLVFTLATLAKRSLDLDSEERLLLTLRRALDPAPAGGLQAVALGRSIRQPNRVDPRDLQIVDAADVKKIAAFVASYLRDDQHGVEKFYSLVKARR